MNHLAGNIHALQNSVVGARGARCMRFDSVREFWYFFEVLVCLSFHPVPFLGGLIDFIYFVP